eukprot:1158297-Pelagomonas_calceolata.AAC.2
MEQSLDVPFKQPVLLNTISADESTGLFAGPVLSYVVFSNLTNPTILVHPNIEGPQITLLASGHPKMGFSLTPLFVHSVYRGEWRAGLIHGCGVQLRRGQQQGQFDVREGKFFADERYARESDAQWMPNLVVDCDLVVPGSANALRDASLPQEASKSIVFGQSTCFDP